MALKLVLAAALVGFAVWLWIFLHPSPEERIRARFAEIARLVSVTADNNNLSRLSAARGLADAFSRDAQISVHVPEVRSFEVEGRDDIFNSASGVLSSIPAMNVEFLDLNILMGPGKKLAEVELTAKISFPREKDFLPQELKCSLKDIDGEWLITRVETVEVLR